MKDFAPRWKDLPDYILGVTKEIWEERGIATLDRTYAADIPVRTPMGVARGNKAVVAATMATLHEFPDRALYGEDVIFSGDDDAGYLSSHRILTTATHRHDGAFGPATGKRYAIRVIAECAAKAEGLCAHADRARRRACKSRKTLCARERHTRALSRDRQRQ
jgi:hypothetical protein